ncbi:formate dehydrogenase accessory sulfurtransferase FdhD [Allorhizobium taibaishanense]|uniref:Sulfur carrier protein FdhD n=1 Tax=Allorhizobium taibaishanense TaxID=887144 RepID=A0A1Q9A1N9_9HYPH|nr:formate dehydrogenase accessory sulfurtransferase FdhD [Allorhizobium taibaishanense]MBB4009229.1 FdhD protein [Allorhizobium taibaishanense]OLP48497.1 sufurtransferase FdhD [Allorhizobium taibaishanense]
MTDRKTVSNVPQWQYRQGATRRATRVVPEEVPVAFSYGGSTHAVMMATPDDLEDFAVGFSLAEGIIRRADEVLDVELLEAGSGIDVQITLRDATAEALTARRRRMAGPVGCGLCGIESIEQATRDVPEVTGTFKLTPAEIRQALDGLAKGQALNRETHAVHAAGFFIPGEGLLAVREDVGRHNALDKLVGAVLKAGRQGAEGVVVVTSRLSVEMVQKTAVLGSPVLLAISAPTALAIRTAEEASMTLIGIARGDDFEVFTSPERVEAGVSADVA